MNKDDLFDLKNGTDIIVRHKKEVGNDGFGSKINTHMVFFISLNIEWFLKKTCTDNEANFNWREKHLSKKEAKILWSNLINNGWTVFEGDQKPQEEKLIEK